MRGVVTLVVVTLMLAGVAIGAYVATDRLLASAYTPRPPLVSLDLEPGENGPPLAKRLVVVVVDGWRSDTLSAMPFTDELWARSASAVLHLTPPANATAGWYTLLTGATPELLGMPLLPSADWPGPPLPPGSLLAMAVAAGRPCAIADHATWQSRYPGDWCAARLFVPGESATADAQIAAGAQDMEQGQPALMLVHLRHLADMGRRYGATGTRYRQAAQTLDAMIRQVVEPALADGAAVAVIGSHGLSDGGRIGGAEAAITQVPFFLMGPGVVPGGYGTIDDVDVAPTLATLIGLPAPALAQGHVRYDMLAGDALWQTGRQLRMATQRVKLAERYLATLAFRQNALADLPPRIAQAETSFQSGDAEAARQSASGVLREADEAMREGRARRLATAREIRLALAAIVLLLWGLIWLLWQRRRIPRVAGAALLGVLATHLAFWISGGRYSLSSVGQVEDFLMAALWQAGIGTIVAACTLAIWRIWRAGRDSNAAQELLGTAWAMIGAWAIPVAVGYGLHGATISWHTPNVTALFWHLWGLTQLWSIPLFAIPITWLFALGSVLTRRASLRDEG